MEDFQLKQLNGAFNGKLNELFNEWIASYPEDRRAKDMFVKDGLLLKYKDAVSGYDINSKWEDAERRIMFIVKDCPDGWGYDARCLLIGSSEDEAVEKNAEKTRSLKSRFFKNIACMLYGLSILTEENKGKEDIFNDVKHDVERLRKVFNDMPFAYIEGKKLAGGRTCSAKKLAEAMEESKDFLSRELDILNPNIIVCCDSDGVIFDNLVRNYFKGAVPDDEHKWEYQHQNDAQIICKLYYYADRGILLFNSYHPSARGADWRIYERVISPFRQFFYKYKTFDVVSVMNKIN